MKNNSSILSVISLCLSVGIILVWIFSNFKLEIIDLSTFIGASVGLIGVMVTFAIGFQIYNALELKQNNERAIMKIKRTELKINRDRENNVIQFKVLNDNIENVIKRFEISSEIRMCYNMGMSAVPFGNYVMVICNFFEAYLHCMDYLDYKDFEDNISTYYIGDPEETIHTPDLNSIKNKILFYLTEYLGDPIVDSEFEEKISIIRYSNFLKYEIGRAHV